MPGRDRTPPPSGPSGPLPYAVPMPVTPPPGRPAHTRIDQVRAELDELSDYLRRQGGEGGPGPEADR
jgi:hypothetical protein